MRKPAAETKPRKRKRLTKAMRRKQLEKATAAYFASLTGEELREENELGRAMASAYSRVDSAADY